MKKNFSTAWNSSTSRRKQRKFRAKCPLHIKRKFLGVHLSPELRKKHNKRAVTIRTGDRVKIMRGTFKGKEGKVDALDAKRLKVFIDTLKEKNPDGSERFIPLRPSNLMITTLIIEDRKRLKKSTGKAVQKEEKKEVKKEMKKEFMNEDKKQAGELKKKVAKKEEK